MQVTFVLDHLGTLAALAGVALFAVTLAIAVGLAHARRDDANTFFEERR